MINFQHLPKLLVITTGLLGVTISTAQATPVQRKNLPSTAVVAQAELLNPVVPANAGGIQLTPTSHPTRQLPPQPLVQPSPSSTAFNGDHEILSHYGLVGTFRGNQLSVRLIDGQRKVYQLSRRVVAQLSLTASSGLPPSQSHVQRGKLVGFETNRKGEITKLVPTAVRRVYDGTVVVVEGEKIGLVNYTGERLVTTLSRDKISKLQVIPGKRLRVTQYQGTWATKVCEPSADESEDAVFSETSTTTLPVGGPAIEPVEANSLPPAPAKYNH